MDARLKAMEAALLPNANVEKVGRATVPAPQQQPKGGLAVLNAKCATCHDVKTAALPVDGTVKTRGGGHAFFEDGQLVVTDKQLNAFYRLLLSGKMPPKDAPQLAEGEGAEVMLYLSSYKPQQAKKEE